MTGYYYDNGLSLEQGTQNYNLGIQYRDQGRKDDARQSLQSAINIFKMCSEQHPEAATYLKQAEQDLQNLE